MKRVLRLVGVGVLGVLLCGASVRGQMLVPAGSDWKYLDNGSNQGTAWKEPGFADGTWKNGLAQLGYGDGDERTVVSFGPSSTAKYITTYFRRTFTAANVAEIQGLIMGVMADDGVVVYLNGQEVFRNNLAVGQGYTTPAQSTVDNAIESLFVRKLISPASLIEGVNVLAAEVHQSGGTSSDISFDLFLKVGNTIEVTRGPYLQLGTTNSALIRWRTMFPTDSQIAFGTDPGALSTAVSDPNVVTEHQIQIGGLTPNTRYYYSVGTTTNVLMSGTNLYFITLPPVGPTRPTRVWAIGDSGTADHNAAAVRDSYYGFGGSRLTDVWLMLGDNAYNSGLDAEFQSAVFDMYPSLLQHSFVYPTIGNHETGQATSIANFAYLDMFSLPTDGRAGGLASGTERYYSYDYADIHFVCLDSMTSGRTAPSPMFTWLQADLAATTQRWIIAFYHHPPYTKGSHDSDLESDLAQFRQSALPILEAGGVDLVLAGHSHVYERSYLLNGHYGFSSTFTPEMKVNSGDGREDGTGAYHKLEGVNPGQGTVYVVAGSSGQARSSFGLAHPAMVVSLLRLGSMVIDVFSNRLDAIFLGTNGVTEDHFTILKDIPDSSLPVFLTQPADVTAGMETTAEFAASVSGPGPLTFQWLFHGTNLPGATNHTLSLPISSLAQAGDYRLVAANTSGSRTSEVAILTVRIPTLAGTGTGLRGEYFDDAAFTVPRLTRVDPTLNFNWGAGSPDASIAVDTFSVRWTGDIEPRYTGDYTLYTISDDGVRVWIDDQLVINNFVAHSATENSATVSLVAGRRYFVRVDYFENTVDAVVQLSWSCLGLPKEIIPQTQLYPVSSPKLVSITRAGTTATLLFTTQAGRSYFVDYKNSDDPVGAAWSFLSGPLPGTSAPVTTSDPAATAVGRFYRVRSN